MEPVWAVILLVTLGFIGGRLAFAKEILPAVFRDIFLTGWEFILIGIVVGPLGFDLVSKDLLVQLNPFLAMGLGWAGLIFGIQLRYRDLLKVDPAMIKLTIFQAVVTGMGLFAMFALFSVAFLGIGSSETITAGMMVAAAGAISSPTILSVMAPRFHRSKSGLLRKLTLIANLDLAPALIAVGLVFCFFSTGDDKSFDVDRGIKFLSYSLLMSMGMAGIFRFFGREKLNREENLTVFLGFLVFISGVAFYINVSPLFLSLMVGIVLANTLPHDDQVFRLLYATEKPFYVILLILSGLWWRYAGPAVFIVSLILVIGRLALKVGSIRAGMALFLKNDTMPPLAGLALGAQGALALAIGLNYVILFPGETSGAVFGVIVLTTVINEIVAPILIQKTVTPAKTEDQR